MPTAAVTLGYFRDPRTSARETFDEVREDCYHLILPLCTGRARLVCDGRPLHDGPVAPGMARVVSPGETVRGVVFSPAEAVTLAVPGPFLRAVFAALGRPHRPGQAAYIDPLIRPDAQVERLARVLVGVRGLDPAHAQLCVDGVAEALLACVLQHHGHGPAAPPGSLSPAQFGRAVAFADATMAGRLDLAGWAAALGLGVADFSRRFRRTAGFAPYAWFMRHRIDRAKEMLVDPRQSIVEIALRVGFASQSHFTEAFRRLTGTSPARWRSDHSGVGIR